MTILRQKDKEAGKELPARYPFFGDALKPLFGRKNLVERVNRLKIIKGGGNELHGRLFEDWEDFAQRMMCLVRVQHLVAEPRLQVRLVRLL